MKHKIIFMISIRILYGLSKEYYLLTFLLALGVAGGIVAFPFLYISASNVLIGLALAPFVIFIQGTSRFNYVFFLAMIFFGLLAYLYHIKVFYFLALAFYFVAIIELTLGRVNTLLFFLIILMSPIFLQVSVILGFPIRLYLSQWAGEILKWMGLQIQVEGNVMLLNGFEFAVDEACMGLNMLAISMLMGVSVIAYHYKLSKQKLSLKYLIVFFLVVFVLNILSNLFRIIILVIFKILPENPWHEIIGVLCLTVYVMVPLYFLGRWMVQHFGKVSQTETTRKAFTFRAKAALVIVALIVFVVGVEVSSGRASSEAKHANVTMQGMKPITMEGGITKFANHDVLMYVKPIPEFFTLEHTPLICWKGSGYTFKSIRKQSVGGREVYGGVLAKNNAVLYTAWWYSNGKVQTIDQFTWRSMMVSGENRFCLVNITMRDQRQLYQQLQSIFENNLLTIQ